MNTGQPNHLNTGQIDTIVFSYVLVRYSNGRSSTLDIAHRPTDHLKSKLLKVRYSNPHCTGLLLPCVQQGKIEAVGLQLNFINDQK